MSDKLYTLRVFLDDVLVSYGTVMGSQDCDTLIEQANKWAGKNHWNRLELGPEASGKKFNE